MPLALTRAVSPAITRCELTHVPREPIDVARACAQHEAYERTLAELGCTVHRIPADAELPDSVFVEDACVVVDELAVITRPGAPSRRPETLAVTDALRRHRRLACIEPPGTLDGGDVLRIGRAVYVGQSTRSNAAGIDQLGRLLAPHGYTVTGVPVRDCLHLKSAVSAVGRDAILVNRRWVDPASFRDVRILDVDPAEPTGANALLIGDRVVYPVAFSATRRRLEAAGVTIEAVDVSELQKAEGGVTCCSVIVEQPQLHS